MIKRVLSIFLVLVLAVGLLPMKAEAMTANQDEQIQKAVSEVIRDYAKKVYKVNADDDAFNLFFRHGFYGNGKDLVLTENSPMVSALFNACVFQEAVTLAVTEAIMTMRPLQEKAAFVVGGPSWHNYYYTYQYSAYRGEERNSGGFWGQLISAMDVYGESAYGGPTNENDEVMELLVGHLTCNIVIRQMEVKDSSVVYELEFKISDNFDFSGDYSHIADKGYDTSKDDKLNNLGYLMTFMGLDTFDWEYSKTLSVEVPVSCEHSSGDSFHWLYTHEDGLTACNDDEFTINEGKAIEVKIEDAVYYQYRLDETVVLRHDQPWVVEYEMSTMERVSLSAMPVSGTCYPYLLQHGLTHLWVPYCEIIKRDEETYGYQWHYMGVEMGKSFTRSKALPYHFIVENVINEDEGNMPWVTVYDANGETVFGPAALDDYWTSSDLDSTRVLTETDTGKVSGVDIIINYIGSKSNPVRQEKLELWIWENGKDADTHTGVFKEPTCSNQGGYMNTCNKCGVEYLTEIIPALGHSYGDYVDDNNRGCVTNATKTRVCSRCGDKDSVEIPDTATGHTYGDYTFDNNATCTADGTQTRKCTVCGETETVTASGTALGHDYNAAVTEPTLTEQGYTTYTCTRCGDSYKDDYTEKKEHKYVAVVTEPTCVAEGFTTYTCSECGDSYVDDYTDMVEHTPVIDPAAAPTCVEKGKTEGSHCGVCGYVIKKQANISTVDRHNYTEEITKVPTYEEAGEVTYTCKDCGKTEVKVVPPFEKPTPNNPFTDVAETDWFYEPVLWALQEDVTKGKTETTFAPNEGCTRAQVVTFLWAANGKPEPESMDNPFDDVASDAWYLKPVLWAVEQGITTGISETTFGPEKTCTRAQIATFLWAAKGRQAVTSESTFVDVAGSEWYATPVIWAAENEVTGGIGEGKFGPEQTCTRAQVVTFLYKVYG